MKKYTHEMLDDFTRDGLYLTIDQLQAELDKKSVPSGNGMTPKQIANHIFLKAKPMADGWKLTYKDIERLSEEITVSQGFVPDWDKAPEWAREVKISWVGGNGIYEEEVIETVYRPRPPRVTRERTREEKIHAIKYYLQTPVVRGFEPMSDKLIDDLCTAAGISLTEEV